MYYIGIKKVELKMSRKQHMAEMIINKRHDAGVSILLRNNRLENWTKKEERNKHYRTEMYIFVAPFFVKTTCHN